MKICQNCNSTLEDNASFCTHCGTNINVSVPQQNYQQRHNVPRCTCCGHVGQWKLGPILRPMDIVIGIAFMFLGLFPGIIYLGVVAAIRSNKDRREKICPQCNAKNLWTFFY